MHSYKVGQVIKYIEEREEWTSEIVHVEPLFVETKDHYSVRLANIICIEGGSSMYQYHEGQIIIYSSQGFEHSGRIDRMSLNREWLFMTNGHRVNVSEVTQVISSADVSSEQTYKSSAERLHIARAVDDAMKEQVATAYDQSSIRIERSAGVPDFTLDNAQRELMIDHALDTNNKTLFMQLTTPQHVGSVV